MRDGNWLASLENHVLELGLDQADDRFICCLYKPKRALGNTENNATDEDVEGEDVLKCEGVVSDYYIPEVDCPSSNIYDISLNMKTLKSKLKKN